MASWTDYLVGPVLVLVVAALATLSVLQHALPIGPELSLVLLVFDTRVLVAVAVAILGGSFLLYLYYLRGEDRGRLVESGRSVEAIVPVHEDADVMDRSVEALLASDYANLSLTVVCEPEDTASIEQATEFSEAHEPVTVLRNTTHEGSKAGALNAAIERTDADVVGLFDADQEPDPRFVPHAMASLEEHEAVRGRNLPDPSGGLLERVVYYEYLVLFFLPQKIARALFGFNFAGTRGVLLEASVFDEVGYFREDTLTEDLEFSHRCHAAGLSIRELLYYPILEAPAHTVRDWWGQRVRWMSGQVAVSAGRLGNWRELFGRRLVGSLVMSLGTFVAGTLMAMTVPKLALGLATSPLVVGGGLAIVFAILVATRLVDNRTSTLAGVGLAWLLLPLAVTLYGIVIVQVVFEHALGIESDWYSIEKVEGSG